MEAATAPQEEETPVVEDWPYEFRLAPLADTIVDGAYQRPLSSLVHKVAREFDPALVGALVLSERTNGKLAVVDGQTRVEGGKRRGLTEMPAVVFMGLTRAQEASLFHRLQRERRNIASYDGFRAALVAGDKQAKAILKIAEAQGYTVGRAAKDKHLTAVAALAYAYRRSPENLERTLIILRAAWADRHVPRGDVIRGLSYWLERRGEKDTDDARLARHLAVVGPEGLARKAAAFREGVGAGGSSNKWFAMALDAVYART